MATVLKVSNQFKINRISRKIYFKLCRILVC